MTKKQLIRAIAFVLICCVVFYVLSDLFDNSTDLAQDESFMLYRSFEEGTVDAVAIGSSGIGRYWIPSQGYEKEGIIMATLSINAMPSWLYINVIEELYKYQDPELILIDIRPFTQSNTSSNTMESRARRVIDSMPLFSESYIKASFDTMDWMHRALKDAPKYNLSILFSFLKYHSRWDDKGFTFENNFDADAEKYGGYRPRKTYTVGVEPQAVVKYDAKASVELDPFSEEALYDLIEYLRKEDIQALFVDTPQFRNDKEAGRANKVYQILEEEDMDYVHYYSENSSNGFSLKNLDPQTDFYDSSHTNFYGAQKVSEAIIKYIDKNYDLPDRRTDEKAKVYWDGVHEKLLELVESKKDK